MEREPLAWCVRDKALTAREGKSVWYAYRHFRSEREAFDWLNQNCPSGRGEIVKLQPDCDLEDVAWRNLKAIGAVRVRPNLREGYD